MKKTYAGGCHCGAIRFEADVDVAAGTIKCNCTICAKSRLWTVDAGPGDLRVLHGADDMIDYRFNNEVAHHYFCRRCGIRPYQWVNLPSTGKQYYNVSVACLEGVDIDELMAAPVTYVDGLHDDWDSIPAEIRHL